MKLKLFGIGAAGNKAAINAINKGIITKDDVYLINTTTKDIPDEFKKGNADKVIQFSSMLGGCGKEPDKGKKAMEEAIINNKIDFSDCIEDDTNEVVLVTSTEGGTGCGATPVIAKYFSMMNVPTHIYAFIGFQDETRGINNTIKFFKNIEGDNIILHTILNDQFLDYRNSYSAAEDAANNEFATQLKIIMGTKMIPSSQNIDDTDHYKITATAGYMDIKHVDLSGVKNIEMFNEIIIKTFDNNKGMDYDKSCKRLAVIINADERVQEAIDSRLEVIKRYSGEPFETFRHIQNNPEDQDTYMDIILSGMNMPEKSIMDMYKKYQTLKEKVSSGVSGIDFSDMDTDDDEFDMGLKRRNTNARQMFVNSLKPTPASKIVKDAGKVKIVTKTDEDY